MISFICPAHNEEQWIGQCLAAIHAAMQRVTEEFEVIVVSDASNDGTETIARQNGAVVLSVSHRHISATRNSGARAANGDLYFFVDADTLINSEIVTSAVKAIAGGAIGGGCVAKFDGKLPIWWRLTYPLFSLGVRVLKLPGGACLFCTREAFETIGGFSEQHYAAEDAVFATALKRIGRFVVIRERCLTSGRNLRSHSGWHIAGLIARVLIRGPDSFRDRKGLDLWYKPSNR